MSWSTLPPKHAKAERQSTLGFAFLVFLLLVVTARLGYLLAECR